MNGKWMVNCLMLGLAMALAGCAANEPADAAAPATAVVSLPPNGFRPMTFFNEHCARCHGPNGAFYGDGFGARHPGAALRTQVQAMASGQAGSPLDEAQLDAMVAYVRSIAEYRPFVIATSVDHTPGQPIKLTGEATSGATVKILIAGQSIPAELNDQSWTATLPAGTDLSEVRVTASKDGREMTLQPR